MPTRQHTVSIAQDGRPGPVCGGVPSPRHPQILFRDDSYTALAFTKAHEPDLIHKIERLRQSCFSRDAALTGEVYGVDRYDDYYKQLVVMDNSSEELVSGMRLGVGEEIITSCGPEGLYTAEYWVFHPPLVEIARRGVEIGRTWIHPDYQKRISGFTLLWKALAFFLDSTRSEFLFGAVSLVGYRQEARERIMNYLWRYHRISEHCARAKRPAALDSFAHYVTEQENLPSDQALHLLVKDLERIDGQWPIPVLLKLYIKLGAVLAGEFAWNPKRNKILGLILLPTTADSTQAALAAFKSRQGAVMKQ